MSGYPQIFRVRQRFDGPQVADVAQETHQALGRLNLSGVVRPGQRVAITVGSRGIANLAPIVKAIADHLRALGAQPFIVPAMGSHGGGTAEGQRRIVEGYGVTESFCGCPILSSMETVVVGRAAEGFPIHFDRHAWEADHVVVCGRIKPHTDFSGDFQSGLMKMLLIGLGKHEGAKIYHRAVLDHGFDPIVRSAGRLVLGLGRIVAGVAIVENGYEQTAQIEALAPQEFEEREKELLGLAKQWMARLPFSKVDLLIVDEIGKNISGAGMDSNIIGRKFNDHEAAPDEWPKVRRIAIRRLTPASHGNAIGLGMAEFCRSGLLAQMDRKTTWINGLTSGHIAAVMCPLYYNSDREILDAALPTIGLTEPPRARLLWIANTLHLGEVECSAAYLDEARTREDLEILTPLRDLPIDDAGNLPMSVSEWERRED